MQFSRSNTYASAVLICALLSPVLPAQAAVPDETTTITLDQAVHFIGTDGSDAVAAPGDYSVEAAQEWLRLIPGTERRDALLIEAQPGTHEVKVEIPIVISTPGTEPDELDVHIVQLLNPDGTSLVANGTYSGIQSRGLRDRARQAAARAREKAEGARRAAAAKAQQTANAARIAALKAKQAAEQTARNAAKEAREKLRVLAEIKAQAGKGLGIDDPKAAAKQLQGYISKLRKTGWTGPTPDRGLAAVRAAKVSSRGTDPTSGLDTVYWSRHTYAPGEDREVRGNDGYNSNCHRESAIRNQESATRNPEEQKHLSSTCTGVGHMEYFRLKALNRVNLEGSVRSTHRMWKDFHILESTTGNPHQVNADFHFFVNRVGLLRVYLPLIGYSDYKVSVRIMELDDWDGEWHTILNKTVAYKEIDKKSVKTMWETVNIIDPIGSAPMGESISQNEATEVVLSPTLLRGHTYRLLLELNLDSRIIVPSFIFPASFLQHTKSDFFKDSLVSGQRSVGLSSFRVKIHEDPLGP